MLAVWSFWTKPFYTGGGLAWCSRRHAWCSWVLSVETARRHFAHTMLVTDRRGADLLAGELGLAFDHVVTALDSLDAYDPEWWALGKLQAYRLADEPFVHIDADAYLWQPLPERLLTAPVLAQNPESFGPDDDEFYRPRDVEQCLLPGGAGWLPRAWWWERGQFPREGNALNCGLFGGNALGFIRHYANLAFAILDHPANRSRLAALPDKHRHILLLEQFLLKACLDYAASGRSAQPKVRCECLFTSPEDAYARGEATGYTHLLGEAKMDPALCARLEQRVQRDYPAAYARILRQAAE